ncbi:MAG: DUF1320 domain-containing protein [Chromatiales bacterium]|nr:DUF1320 domain-containing protein [Gammaproteobacteria bacterium]
MSYCTQQDLIDRFGEDELIQLTDRNDLGMIDSAMVDAATNRSDNKIDRYCRDRYILPLNPAVDVLDIACDLSRFYLYEDNTTEEVEKRRDQALTDLRDIATGRQKLSAAIATTGSSGMPEFQTGTRVFSRDTLDGF